MHPFDVIVVTAAGPDVPQSLKQQLAIGGRLVMPVGECRASQILLRVSRTSENEFVEEDLGGVRFVPSSEKKVGKVRLLMTFNLA